MTDPYDVRHAAIASDDGMPEPSAADTTPHAPTTSHPSTTPE
jgi:hypothetical protein